MMQALEALRMENVQLRDANRQMQQQLTGSARDINKAVQQGGKSPCAQPALPVSSRLLGTRGESPGRGNVSPQRCTTVGSYIPSSTTVIATRSTTPVSRSRSMGEHAQRRIGEMPRSLSPVPGNHTKQQAQDVLVQVAGPAPPLHHSQSQPQPQWPNPAAAVRILSPTGLAPGQFHQGSDFAPGTSARCVSPPPQRSMTTSQSTRCISPDFMTTSQSARCVSPPPKSVAQPAHTMRTPIGASTQRQTVSRMAPGPAGMSASHNRVLGAGNRGRAVGPQSPVSSMRERR